MKKKLAVAIALAVGLNMGLGQIVQNDFTAKMGLNSRAEAFNIFSLFAPSKREIQNSYKKMISYYMAGFELSSQAAAVSHELLNDYGVQAELVNVNGINASTAGYDSSVDMVMKRGNSGKTVKMPEIDAVRFFNMVPEDDTRLEEAKRLVMLKDEYFSRGRDEVTFLAAQVLLGGGDRTQNIGMLIGSALLLSEWKDSLDSTTGASYRHFEDSLRTMNRVEVDKRKIKEAADHLPKL
ncbi:hypothetical protein D081_0311 [Anaerovibrio sp. JC8]|uniref:hypothetical protein n=1 Tax=Anaerovibrio sp. JC8 TaxID=1240085 RepID=UPI000A0A702A|nr:hypothetical protein [Anaerovibrio sp. JC8]ORU01492.1 hypothetical protein D081_0311 [Anaerovibrio sp. JC8]